MAKINVELRKMFAACFIVLSTIVVMSGCGAESTKAEGNKAFIDVSADGRIVTANFDGTKAGTAGASGITINENEYLIIDRALSEGVVHVKLIPGGDDIDWDITNDVPATIDYIFDEAGIVEYESIAPGNYMVKVEVEENATGTVAFSVMDATAD